MDDSEVSLGYALSEGIMTEAILTLPLVTFFTQTRIKLKYQYLQADVSICAISIIKMYKISLTNSNAWLLGLFLHVGSH